MSIELNSRVGPDGVLELRVPLGQSAANAHVHVKIDTTAPRFASQAEWQAFIQQIAGSVQDESFVRPPQADS